MNADHEDEELADALTVFRARRRIDSAIAELASRPLDVATAEQMRAILASDELAAARRIVRQSGARPSPPMLYVVPDRGGDG